MTITLEELILRMDFDGMHGDFPDVQKKEEIDLSGFDKQISDIEGVEYEYIDQYGCGDYGFSGTIVIPYGDKGMALVVNFEE